MAPVHPHPSLAELIAAHQPGHSLEGGFYVREDVFAKDMALLLDRWLIAGHASEVIEPGDWLTAELGDESAIVVRGEDGALRAFANVCRHRGSRVCDGPRGHAAVLTCPYHAWSYHLDGRLRARAGDAGGLRSLAAWPEALPLREIGGLIFVSFGDDPPVAGRGAPRALERDDRPVTAGGNAKIAARRTYDVAANWKLAMENYHECYHCAPAHPEFSLLHALARPDSAAPADQAGSADGHGRLRGVGRRPPTAGGGAGHALGPRRGVSSAAATTGELSRPPMGAGGLRRRRLRLRRARVPRRLPGLCRPRGDLPLHSRARRCTTEMEVIWLVRGDGARRAATTMSSALTWLWDVTSLADKRSSR